MKERDLENILERYPELIEDGLSFEGRQVPLGRRHIDLMFKDKFGQKLVVELKKGTILRDHIGQVFEYEGDVLTPDDPNVRVMLIGNRVPPNMRRSLEHHGFEWREFSIAQLIKYLKDKEDAELLSYFYEEMITAGTTATVTPIQMNSISRPLPEGMKINDKMDTLFASNNIGMTLTRKQIIDMVLTIFPGTHISSVIPSDYCYNIINAGIKFDHHLFEYITGSMYKVLGKNYPFVGPISWKGRKVGDWQEGSPSPILYERVSRRSSIDGSYYFLSIGPSAFVNSTRNALEEAIRETRESTRWKLGGSSSLTAAFVPATDMIRNKYGESLIAQIWMERPKKGSGASKFEIASKIRSLRDAENKARRDTIALSMRTHLMKKGLPDGVVIARGSTVIKCRILVPEIKDVKDDTSENAERYACEIKEIVAFFRFLNSALSDWTI